MELCAGRLAAGRKKKFAVSRSQRVWMSQQNLSDIKDDGYISHNSWRNETTSHSAAGYGYGYDVVDYMLTRGRQSSIKICMYPTYQHSLLGGFFVPPNNASAVRMTRRLQQ